MKVGHQTRGYFITGSSSQVKRWLSLKGPYWIRRNGVEEFSINRNPEFFLFSFRALYYCSSCHRDVTDLELIKECKCEKGLRNVCHAWRVWGTSDASVGLTNDSVDWIRRVRGVWLLIRWIGLGLSGVWLLIRWIGLGVSEVFGYWLGGLDYRCQRSLSIRWIGLGVSEVFGYWFGELD